MGKNAFHEGAKNNVEIIHLLDAWAPQQQVTSDSEC